MRKSRSSSLYSIARGKLKKDFLAMAGLLVIILAVLVGILAYVISPDNTPYANTQHLELATMKPGSHVDMLKVRKNETPVSQSIITNIIYGKSPAYKMVPFSKIEFTDTRVLITEYSDGASEQLFQSEYDLLDVVFAINANAAIQFDNGKFRFQDINNNIHVIEQSNLNAQIQEENIESVTFLLGTDRFGRDLLSRLIVGTRVSLAVGFIAVFISVIIGLTLGLISGYFMGTVDKVIMWLINVVWSIPTLLMVIAITMAIGKGYWQVFIAVGITMWVEVARVTRGQVMSIREKEYIEAARALGYGHTRIILKHILPNILNPIIIISAANFASAILIEAGLSFLGLGVQPPTPSWGSMIKDHYGYIIVDLGYLAILPGVAIMIMVLAFTLLGNGLRDALDTRT